MKKPYKKCSTKYNPWLDKEGIPVFLLYVAGFIIASCGIIYGVIYFMNMRS